MFAVPIDNTGLASFVPVRRQSGSSVGQQNLGFDIFGRPIKIRDDDTDIGGTDVGQITQTQINPGQIEQAQVLAPGLAGLIPPRRIDGGVDEAEGPQPTDTTDINIGDISEAIEGKVDEFGDKFSAFLDDPIPTFNPDKGPLGTVENILGGLVDDINVAQKGTEVAVEQGLSALFGSKSFIVAPMVDVLIGSAFGKGDFIDNIEGRDIAYSFAKGITGLALGPIGPLVVSAIQALVGLFSDPDYDGDDSGPGGLGAPPGGAVDFAMGGLGEQFSRGPKYGFWTGLTDPGFEDPEQTSFISEHTDYGKVPNITESLIAAGMPTESEPTPTGAGSTPADQATSSDEGGDVW